MHAHGLLKKILLSACLSLTFQAAAGHAATPTSYLINLDAKVNSDNQPVPLYLVKGRYEVRPVGRQSGGKFTAWSVWDRTNCARSAGCSRTVPTRYTGMHNNYYVISPNLTQATVNGRALPVVSETPRDRNFSYFLATPQTRAYEVTGNRIYPDEASALRAAHTSEFTVGANGRVYFALLDNSRRRDNRGGMSLLIRKLPD